jgi:hypothetical protein
LQTPYDPHGQPKRDKRNPDPALRQRELCGLTLIWGLHSTGLNHWDDGWAYYPDSGKTYNIKMDLTSSDDLAHRKDGAESRDREGLIVLAVAVGLGLVS